VSSNIFPILPLIQPATSARPTYATRDLVAVSGKRISVAWRASSITALSFRLRLRSWKMAPNETGSGGQNWASYTEPDLFLAFFNTHKGKWDSWLLNNTAGAYWRGGPTQPRVRFTSDECPIVEDSPGLYTADVELETVL
jgi:hypothetical protein